MIIDRLSLHIIILLSSSFQDQFCGAGKRELQVAQIRYYTWICCLEAGIELVFIARQSYDNRRLTVHAGKIPSIHRNRDSFIVRPSKTSKRLYVVSQMFPSIVITSCGKTLKGL